MYKSKSMAAVLLLGLSGIASSAIIESVGYSSPDGGEVRLALVFSAPVEKPLIFQPSDDVINFVFDDTSIGSQVSQHPEMGGLGIIKSAKVIEQGTVSILSVNLAAASNYEVKRSGPLVLITMSEAEESRVSAPSIQVAKVEVEPEQAEIIKAKANLVDAAKAVPDKMVTLKKVVKTGEAAQVKVKPKTVKLKSPVKLLTNIEKSKSLTSLVVQSIDFHRVEDGGAKISFKLNKNGVKVVATKNGNMITVLLPKAILSKEMKSKFDVTDFGTIVQMVETVQGKDSVKLNITLKDEPFEVANYQLDGSLIIEVTPQEEEDIDQDFQFTGEKVTLDFQSIEVRAVLKLLAGFTKLNLITSDSVKGDITINLVDVPWDQALDLILKIKGLAMRKQGNVMLIAPAIEVAVREKQELINKKQSLRLKNIGSRLIEINFAKVSDIAKIIEESSVESSAENDNTAGFLSERGKITIDERTNSLLVWDTSDRLQKIEAMIKKLDKPIRQVLIESRIVIANRDFSEELGARFGIAGSKNGVGAISGTLNDLSISGGQIGNSGAISSPSNTSSISANQGLNINMPVASPAGSIALSLARLPVGNILQLELSAMHSEGRGEIVSSPRVITSNKRRAIIKQGTEIPYQEASSSGSTSVSFKEALLKLEVTPQITPNNQIIMDININKDSIGAVFNGVPSINTQGIETQVLVNNGETIVLGGIHEEVSIDKILKVPVLGDIPYIGVLFRNKNKIANKSELLVFITPKIIDENLSLWKK